MKFDEFIRKVKEMGGVDTDGKYGKQCMDLYNYYCNKVLGLKNTGAECAKDILNNPNIMNYVERIDNYPAFVPQKGDIAVFTGSKCGHVAICLGVGDRNTFKTLDQNWKSQRLTEETHNYTSMGPIVFLRPKNQSNIKDEKYFYVRVDKYEANVRTEPNTRSSIVIQPGGEKCLKRGDTFKAIKTVRGEKIDGNDVWYESYKGNYVWSGGLTRI